MNSTAYINSLHAELLALTFSLVTHEMISVPTMLAIDVFRDYSSDSWLTESTRKQTLKKAIILSGVCRYWRDVILPTSSFWTYVPITLSNKHLQRSLDSVPVWIDRARTLPLDIYITTPRYRDTPTPETELDQVVPRLSFGSRQIGTLHLSLLSAAYLNTLLKTWFSNGVCTTLTKLDIDVNDVTDEILPLQDWISQCQELQALRLNTSALCSDHFPPMSKLVKLALSSSNELSITTKRLSNVLHACPNLQRLQLNYLYLEDAASGHLIPAPLQHLEMLDLQFIDTTRIFPLLSSKSNSLSLSILHVSEDDPSREAIDHVIHFSRHTTITGLDLWGKEIESSDLCRFISSLPLLQTLSLKECHLDNLMASVLQEANKPDRVGGAGSSTSPVLHTIWLVESTVSSENTLRSLVGLLRLNQLKLEHCHFFEPSGTIIEAKELCEYLADAVSDLSIMNHDENKRPVYFPSMCMF